MRERFHPRLFFILNPRSFLTIIFNQDTAEMTSSPAFENPSEMSKVVFGMPVKLFWG